MDVSGVSLRFLEENSWQVREESLEDVPKSRSALNRIFRHREKANPPRSLGQQYTLKNVPMRGAFVKEPVAAFPRGISAS